MNDISVFGGKALTEIDKALAEALAEEGNAFELVPTRITIAPGGIGAFTDGADTYKTLSGIVLVSQIARAFWPERGSGLPPFCSSHDGIIGRLSDPDDVDRLAVAADYPGRAHPATGKMGVQSAYACSDCPLSEFGSAAMGRGQACKALRRLVVWLEGEAQPSLLTLPPTSTKAWDTYCSALGRKRQGYFTVRTQFSLEKAQAAGGEPYSVVKVVKSGDLDAGEMAQVLDIRRGYLDLVRSTDITVQEYDDRGVATADVEIVNDDEDVPF